MVVTRRAAAALVEKKETYPVEVSIKGKGFENSWYGAKLIEHREKETCLVEYDTLLARNGKGPLRETINVSQIRPQPPQLGFSNSTFANSEKVDALYRDGWWVGVITSVLSNSNYGVYFKETSETLIFHPSQLRVHQEWSHGRWITDERQCAKLIKPENKVSPNDDAQNLIDKGNNNTETDGFGVADMEFSEKHRNKEEDIVKRLDQRKLDILKRMEQRKLAIHQKHLTLEARIIEQEKSLATIRGSCFILGSEM